MSSNLLYSVTMSCGHKTMYYYLGVGLQDPTPRPPERWHWCGVCMIFTGPKVWRLQTDVSEESLLKLRVQP